LNDEIEDLSHPHDAALTSSEPNLSPFHKVFLGPDGLRAGWSLLIFILLLVGLVFAGNFIAHKILPPAPKAAQTSTARVLGVKFAILNELVPFLAVLLATWIMSKIERRPNSVYGLGGSRKLPQLFAGLAWGVLCLSLLVFILLKTGFLVIDSRLIFGSDILRYGALWLIGFLLVGLLEEYLTRGYLQYTLTRGLAGIYKWAFKTRHSAALGFWTSAFIFSFLFGLGHGKNPGESPVGLASAGLVGLVFCLSLWRTGSLWWALGFHATWDWAQSFLYGVADSGTMVQHHLLATHPLGRVIFSGGATGPEGSIFILGVLVLIVLIIFFTLPDTDGGYTMNLPARLSPAAASEAV
jgi:membrane protease YdiL (CAAX protease family)